MNAEEDGSNCDPTDLVCPHCGVGYTVSKKKELVDILLEDLLTFGIEC